MKLTEADKSLGKLALHDLSKLKNEAGASAMSQLLSNKLDIKDNSSTKGASWFKYIFRKSGVEDQRPHGIPIDDAGCCEKATCPQGENHWDSI